MEKLNSIDGDGDGDDNLSEMTPEEEKLIE
jgi:hypothetical protein